MILFAKPIVETGGSRYNEEGFVGTRKLELGLQFKFTPKMLLATIAGLFYGLTYIKTKNIWCAVFIHTLTNLCWQLFFVTNG